MTYLVMLRTVRLDGSRVSENRSVVPVKHYHIPRSRMGGGSVFRRTETIYSRIERAIDGGSRRRGGC